jgi:hypothetical protein
MAGGCANLITGYLGVSMDSWLQRLVVRGPADDMAAFKRAAASRSKLAYLTVDPQHRTQKLSFKKLRALLPPKHSAKIDDDPEEPWDLVVDRVWRLNDGTRQITYRFQLAHFDCDTLIREVSKLYPRLCLVLGCVEPAGDEQLSLLAYRGRVSRWRLPDAIREEMLFEIPIDAKDDDDEAAWMLDEANWAMMDMVVEHWRTKVDKLMSRALSGLHTRKREAFHPAR